MFPDKLTIEVTQADIDSGVTGNCFRCPIARALCRTLGAAPSDRTIYVDATEIMLSGDDDSNAYYPLGDVGELFVRYFDSGNPATPVAPFTFTAERSGLEDLV
jgi:hypothetical protein